MGIINILKINLNVQIWEHYEENNIVKYLTFLLLYTY